MRMSICLNAEAEEYRMFRVSFPDYFAAHCGLEFDASPAAISAVLGIASVAVIPSIINTVV